MCIYIYNHYIYIYNIRLFLLSEALEHLRKEFEVQQLMWHTPWSVLSHNHTVSFQNFMVGLQQGVAGLRGIIDNHIDDNNNNNDNNNRILYNNIIYNALYIIDSIIILCSRA